MHTVRIGRTAICDGRTPIVAGREIHLFAVMGDVALGSD